MNFLKKYYFLLSCAWVVVWTSILILKTKSRLQVNQYVRHAGKKILKILNIQLTTKMMGHFQFDPHHPYIFMSNHQSMIDLPVIYAAMPGTIRVIIKKELLKFPIFGSALRKSECIPIDRSNPHQTMNLIKIAKEKLFSGIHLWIFPEGTRSRTGELLSLKNGGIRLACELGATIIPVGITGTHQILPAKTFNLKRNQSVTVRIGEPIATTGFADIFSQHQLQLKVHSSIKKLIEDKL